MLSVLSNLTHYQANNHQRLGAKQKQNLSKGQCRDARKLPSQINTSLLHVVQIYLLYLLFYILHNHENFILMQLFGGLKNDTDRTTQLQLSWPRSSRSWPVHFMPLRWSSLSNPGPHPFFFSSSFWHIMCLVFFLENTHTQMCVPFSTFSHAYLLYFMLASAHYTHFCKFFLFASWLSNYSFSNFIFYNFALFTFYHWASTTVGCCTYQC